MQRQSPCKHYVKVRADHLLNGHVRPLMFRTEDGPAIRIDQIVDVRPAASLKAGGAGIRYICRVEDKQIQTEKMGKNHFMNLPLPAF